MRAGRLPDGARIVADERVRLWRDGRTALGGSPWGVVRLGSAAAELLLHLRAAGGDGLTPGTDTERAAADRLVERGLAHPLPPPRQGGARAQVEVVVPAFGRADRLAACLDALGDVPVVVVDDASPTPDVQDTARSRGVRVVRHAVNRGPAAARNTGLNATTAALIAFVDDDCIAPPGWLETLLPLFDDERVGAVAPRVAPRSTATSLLARHERTRSALDMGSRRALVRPGGPLGFLPSAALVVRREAVQGSAFDEGLRLGEDVDLVWRLADDGWHVRYEPSVTVEHAMRLGAWAWAYRRFEYGTSAAQLDLRHPGRLAPARLSAWNLVSLSALVTGRLRQGGAVAGVASLMLAFELSARRTDPLLAPVIVGKGLFADAVAIGHGLRREWWPVGWLALAAAPRSRPARVVAAAMLLPIAMEWLRHRPEVDPGRYAALRLVEDAAYGSGVLASALRTRRATVLAPRVRLPYFQDAVRHLRDAVRRLSGERTAQEGRAHRSAAECDR